MASSIVVPNRERISEYSPAIAQALIDGLTATKADIDAFTGAVSPVADATALAALSVASLANGAIVAKLDDGTLWRYHSTSVATDSSSSLVIAPGSGAGKWLLYGKTVILSCAATFATADAAVLFTVPAGARLRPKAAWWDVATTFAGGSSSAIGASSSVSGFSTKGDMLGGAAGDVAATLVSTNTREVGTVGTTFTSTARLILIAGDTLKFDRITSVFTSGAANLRVACDVIANAGA